MNNPRFHQFKQAHWNYNNSQFIQHMRTAHAHNSIIETQKNLCFPWKVSWYLCQFRTIHRSRDAHMRLDREICATGWFVSLMNFRNISNLSANKLAKRIRKCTKKTFIRFTCIEKIIWKWYAHTHAQSSKLYRWEEANEKAKKETSPDVCNLIHFNNLPLSKLIKRKNLHKIQMV